METLAYMIFLYLIMSIQYMAIAHVCQALSDVP